MRRIPDENKQQIKKRLLNHLKSWEPGWYPDFRWCESKGWQILCYVTQKHSPSEHPFYNSATVVEGRPVLDAQYENELIAKVPKIYCYQENGWQYYWASPKFQKFLS